MILVGWIRDIDGKGLSAEPCCVEIMVMESILGSLRALRVHPDSHSQGIVLPLALFAAGPA